MTSLITWTQISLLAHTLTLAEAWPFGNSFRGPVLDGTWQWQDWEGKMPSTTSFPPDYDYVTKSSTTYGLDCDKAPESCQNVCWYKYCMRNEMTFSCNDASGDKSSRATSGCQYYPCSSNLKKKGDNCKTQKTEWWVYHGGNGMPSLRSPQYNGNPECDEFPANTFKQVAEARRSLRCIGDVDNKASGQMYKAMCKNIANAAVDAKKSPYFQELAELQSSYHDSDKLYRDWYAYGDYNTAERYRLEAEDYSTKYNNLKATLDATSDKDWFKSLLDEDRKFNILPVYNRKAVEGYCRVPYDGYSACLWEKPQGENSEDSGKKNVGQFYWMSKYAAGGVANDGSGSQKYNYFANGPFWAQVEIRNPGGISGGGLPVFQGSTPFQTYGIYHNPGGGSSTGAGYQGSYYRRVKRAVGSTTLNQNVSATTNASQVADAEYEWVEIPQPQGLRGFLLRLARTIFGDRREDLDPASYHPSADVVPEPFKNKTLILEDGRKFEHHGLKLGDSIIQWENETAIFYKIMQEL